MPSTAPIPKFLFSGIYPERSQRRTAFRAWSGYNLYPTKKAYFANYLLITTLSWLFLSYPPPLRPTPEAWCAFLHFLRVLKILTQSGCGKVTPGQGPAVIFGHHRMRPPFTSPSFGHVGIGLLPFRRQNFGQLSSKVGLRRVEFRAPQDRTSIGINRGPVYSRLYWRSFSIRSP